MSLSAAATAALEDLVLKHVHEEFQGVVLDPAGKIVRQARWTQRIWELAMADAVRLLKISTDGVAAGVRRRYATDWGKVEG